MAQGNTAEETTFFRILSEGDEAAIRACVANNPGYWIVLTIAILGPHR